MLLDRGVEVDHTSIFRWIQAYAVELEKRIRPHLRMSNGSWRVDETYVKVKDHWTYLYRAVDSRGQTIDFLLSAKRFFRKALAQLHTVNPRTITVDKNAAGVVQNLLVPGYTSMRKQPACEGRISTGKVFCAGGGGPPRVKLAGAEAVPGPAGSASADGLGRSSARAGSCPGARHAGCAGSADGSGRTAADPGTSRRGDGVG